MNAKDLKAKLQRDLQVLMSANKIVSSHGELEIDLETTLHLFNALRPILMRKIKQKIKETAVASALPGQMDIVDEIADKAVKGIEKDVIAKIKKS